MPGIVMSGTKREMEWIKIILVSEGINAEIKYFDSDPNNNLANIVDIANIFPEDGLYKYF